MYYIHYVVPTEKDGVRLSRSGVIDKCKPPYGWWGPNLDPLQEQQVLLTPVASPASKLTIFELPNLLSI